jgi:hypothetical protein
MRFLLPVAALLIAAPAQAQTRVCTDLEEFVERQTDAGGIVRPVRGIAAQAAIALYNSTPPPSDATFDLVVVVERPDQSAFFWFGNAGEVCVFLAIPPTTWPNVRERFVGRPA